MEKIEILENNSPPKNWEECIAKYPELVERRKVCRKYGLLSAIAIVILFTLFAGIVGIFLSPIPAFVIGMVVYLFSLASSIPKSDRGFMIEKHPKLLRLSSWDGSYKADTLYYKRD